MQREQTGRRRVPAQRGSTLFAIGATATFGRLAREMRSPTDLVTQRIGMGLDGPENEVGMKVPEAEVHGNVLWGSTTSSCSWNLMIQLDRFVHS
jgi:hypothetical protein